MGEAQAPDSGTGSLAAGLIAAAYEDGRVVLWDVATRQPWFELRGRGVLISSVQYDDTRLLADGTSSAFKRVGSDATATSSSFSGSSVTIATTSSVGCKVGIDCSSLTSYWKIKNFKLKDLAFGLEF